MLNQFSARRYTTQWGTLASSAFTLLLAACSGNSPAALTPFQTSSIQKPMSLTRTTPAEQTASPAIKSINKEKVARAVERYRINTGGKEATYKIAGADLDGNGNVEALIHVSGEDWCAATGCTLLVMRESATGYDLVSLVKRVRLPVGVSPRSTAGWRDLVLATGPQATRRVVALKFNGSGYPGNASILPPVQAGETATPEIALRAPPRTTTTAARSSGNLIAGQN